VFQLKILRVVVASATIFAIAIFPSCGSSSSSPPPPKPTLKTIAVSPADPQLFLGVNQRFTATGTLTDGSTQDLTQTVKWSSSDLTVMLLNNSAGRVGVGNTRDPGTATTSASNATLTGTATVTVTRRTPAFHKSTGANAGISFPRK
jgi:trimeric autotransporter adhesin